MGCGASVARPAYKKNPSTPNTQRAKVQITPDSTVLTLMASLQGHVPDQHTDGVVETKTTHTIEIRDSVFPETMPERIECDDIVEFNVDGREAQDIFQVYRDGDDYYPVTNGYQLLHINSQTPENERRIILSIALNQAEIDLYFCIIPSSERETTLKTRKCPKVKCEKNLLKVQKCQIKISLTDERESQKVNIHKGDTVEINWTTKNGSAYRIEEKKYCPVSGGLYTVEQKSDNTSYKATAKGKFSRTFNDFGMSFIFRFNNANQVHDITVCIVNESYKVKHIEINDNNIQPNLIWIEQSDWIIFDWNTKRKQTVIEIEPFILDENKQQSIELKTDGKHFFWPHEPSRRGFMYHQFNETGIYCFKNGTNQIGTIIVEPHKTIYHIPVFGDQLIHKMITKDLVQFDWKMTDSNDDPVFITLDLSSSVVPDAVGGLPGIFDCAIHKCSKVEPFFRHHFHTCEAFLLTIPQHGLYNFAYTDNRDNNLISVIIENGIDSHRVVYHEDNKFEPPTLIVNRNDHVWFDSSTTTIASIYETDEYGEKLDSKNLLFRPQKNSINYFMKDFPQEGIYYFTTDINTNDNKTRTRGKTKKSRNQPLAVIVLPDIRFHYRTIRKNDFDHHPIVTNINDFVVWQFEHVVAHNVVQIDLHATIQDIIASHDRAAAGRNRQCLAVECIMPGTFFFSNPEFERAAGSEQDRLISTIVIDPPFAQNCFIVADLQFVPAVLHIAQNETVSWVLSSNEQRHQISVQPRDAEEEYDGFNFIDGNLAPHLHDVHHLHTFTQPGEYIIQSDRFKAAAIVFVYTEDTIRTQKRRVQEPQILGDMDIVSPYSAQVQLSYPSRHVKVLYTLDGSPPTRHFDNVQEYDVDTGVHFTDSGLHLIRAYSIQDEKISSSVVTSSVTYVLESKDREDLKRRQMLWNRAKLSLSASLQQPNKIYGTIAVEPAAARDLIDYYELYINGVGLKKPMKAADGQFLAQGFAGGESYEIYVVGYPREDITNVEPIPSDKRSFDIRREVPGGGPLISISLSNDQASLYLMWAHLGNHVSEYIIYVDNIETKIMKEEAFSDFIGIQFHGAQQRRKYVLHVEAKLKDTNEIRKSNVVPVSLPLNMPLKDPVSDGFFPYITTDDEGAPPDTRLEVVRLDALPTERPQITRKTEILPITTGLRNAIPTISYKRSANGITLYWNIKTEAIADSVENFRIIVDEQPYGKLIAPRNETKYHLNLLPGKHECYLEVLPKDENEEIYKSNVLKIEVPPTAATATTTTTAAAAGIKSEPKQYKEPIDKPVHQIIEQKDVPIPKLNIQTINSSSIRATWYLDRPMPTDVFVALYEVHVRGKEFYEQMTSVEQIYQETYIEHIWHTTSSPLEITGISDRNEYTIYIRALFHVQGTSDIEYARTTSNEVTTARVDPLIDLLPRPLLTVTRVGLQMANLSWKLDDSVDRTLVKGYRIILNSKPTEILPPTQHEYELKNLKPGTTNEIQVSVTSHPDFVDEKVSEPIRIVCPQRPPAPVIQAIRADKPYSVAIKWHIDTNNQDELSSFKVYLDSKLHGEVETNGRQSFKYTLNKLQPEQTYSIYVKAFIEQKKLHGYVYQCDIESKASNELLLKCAVPPKGTIPRIERMHLNGVDLVWDPSEEYGDVKITGYQVLRNGRAVGKVLPVDKRRASINDLAVGNRYSFQIVPITDQPGGTLFRTGEEYDPERHEHYIPGPKLDFEYTDLMPVLTKFWIENIAGHSALACWSSTDETSSKSVHPDGYKLYIWNNKDLTRDKPRIEQIPKDKTSAQLKDLEADTTYEVQLEAYKKRRHPTTNDTYFVASKSEIITFDTGSPPDAPMNLYLIACTNTDARIGFDPFVEHKAEIETIHVQCEPVSTDTNAREISIDVTPDVTEFVLTNLTEHTEYNVTIYGVTGEYLNENRLRDVTQLPKKLKPSEWLPNKSFQFQTSGCESTEHINIRQATSQSIQLDWQLPKVYGSTLFIGQILRWKLEPGGEEQTRDIGRNATNAIIPGPLPSGPYKIHLDSIFSIKINLEANDDDTSRKEIRYTASESINVRFHAPATCERPEIYLTGYTTNTIDLSWTKPNLFSVIDHPEKNNEQLIIHRRLVGYRIDIGGRQKQL